MTRDDILRMAREAGLQQRHATPTEWWCWEGSIERFAALAAAAEREACAKVADLVAREIDDTNGTATYIAAVIRARSKT